MLKNVNRYFDFAFYLRFASFFLLFYFIYTFVVAASAPSGYYYPFIERYLNFPVVIRQSVLNVSQYLLSLMGYATTIVDDRLIAADGYNILQMAWACCGLGMKSFWIAFVCAHSIVFRSKLLWSAVGVAVIFFLNCIRVTVLMIAKVDHWTTGEYLGTNNHDLFDYVCYAALLGLILLFYARSKSSVKQELIHSHA